MKKDGKLRKALVLGGVFAITFAVMYMAVFLTQSAYSMPSSSTIFLNGMQIALGPSPNSTNVVLNTAITVEAVASASLDDMRLTPEMPIARASSEVTGPLTYRNVFYPAKLLEPATSYDASVTIMGTPVTWRFTTTTEPFRPETSLYLATNAHWIALLAASVSTIIAGFGLQRGQKPVEE